MADEIVQVVVGVLPDHRGNVLIAKRPESAHQGGLWEFPGGKIEPGESSLNALGRELEEELGVVIHSQSCVPLLKIPFAYPDKKVELDIWQINQFEGKPHGREGQILSWVPLQGLENYQFPRANRSIVRALQLPRVVAITGAYSSDEDFSNKLADCLKKEVKLLHLRLADDANLESLTTIAAKLCVEFGAELVLNTSVRCYARLKNLGATGLHVNSRRLLQLDSRPVDAGQRFSASCHNLKELHHAQNIGADYVLLSPVEPGTSHHDARALRWSEFRELRLAVSLPVYAHGGLHMENLEQAIHMGAHGIAATSALWS